MARLPGAWAMPSITMLTLAAGLRYDPLDEGRSTMRLPTGPGCWDHNVPRPGDAADFQRSMRAFELEGSLAGVSLEMNASMEYTVKNLRRRCVGGDWNGLKCHILTQRMRFFAWDHVRKLAQEGDFEVPKQPPLIKRFRRGGGLGVDVPCIGGGHGELYYRHIYKCAGLAIKENLAANAQLGQYAVDTDWGESQRCKELVHRREMYAAHKSTVSMQEAPGPRKPLLFTFVRNPITKFVAGYKEIASRGLLDDMRNGVKVGSTRHAEKFLENVVHGTCDNGHVLLQVQNLFAKECESHFDFIGKLEKLEEDWKQVGVEGGCPGGLKWRTQPEHKSDVEDPGAEEAMQNFLARGHHRFLKVLCWWMLPDFIVFDYELPEPCAKDQHLNSVYTSGR